MLTKDQHLTPRRSFGSSGDPVLLGGEKAGSVFLPPFVVVVVFLSHVFRPRLRVISGAFVGDGGGGIGCQVSLVAHCGPEKH